MHHPPTQYASWTCCVTVVNQGRAHPFHDLPGQSFFFVPHGTQTQSKHGRKIAFVEKEMQVIKGTEERGEEREGEDGEEE